MILQTEQLRTFISEYTFTKPEAIKDDTMLFDEGIFDSLGFLSLITHINETHGVEVNDDELNNENFESINAIVAFIDKKKQSI